MTTSPAKRRQTLIGLAVTLTAASLTWAGANLITGTDSSALAQTRTLTMGTSPDYPPYEFYDTSTGQELIVGFDIDIANRIAEELGFELRVSGMDFSGLIPALQANRVDFVMAGMTPTEERLVNADFSDIYFEAQNTIVSLVDSGLTDVAALAGKRLGVQLGSIQEGDAQALAEEDPSIEVVSLNKIGEIVQEIKSRRIDAAIIEDTVAAGFTASNPDLEFSVIPSDGPSGSAVAFPKGSDLVEDFNRVLAEMQASGEIEELVVKWFGEDSPALEVED
ncbi:MAG: transporter substrate-binding domain-containing protein [Cyanophyceae cyanobacterium]